MPIQIIKDFAATLDVDVVVNAANRNLRQGTGLSDALFKAAGAAEMRAACRGAQRVRKLFLDLGHNILLKRKHR